MGQRVVRLWTEPLRKEEAETLLERLVKRYKAESPGMRGLKGYCYYSEREAEIERLHGEGCDAVFLNYQESLTPRYRVDGFFCWAQDADVVFDLFLKWEGSLWGDGLVKGNCRYDRQRDVAEVMYRVSLKGRGSTELGAEHPWYKLVEAMVWLFGGGGLRYTLWSAVPGMKGMDAKFVDADSGERLAEVFCPGHGYETMRDLEGKGIDERSRLYDVEYDLGVRYQTGAMAKRDYEKALREVKRAVLDWYTEIWVETVKRGGIQVKYVSEEVRRGRRR